MTKEFVKYNQAVALKELEFDEPCLAGYQLQTATLFSDIPHTLNGNIHRNSEGSFTCAPLYSQAFRWFRDVHELEGVPQKADSFSWFKFCIWKYTSNGKHRVNDAFDFEHKTYEEAESACLDKLIEIIKNR